MTTQTDTTASATVGTTMNDLRASIEQLSQSTAHETSIDGRTRRRRRNVDAVLDSVVDLAREGNLDPTSEEIAERAGVSHRSIYRYFASRNSLLEAALVRTFETVAARLFFAPVGEGTLDERIEQFVDARVTAYWAFRDIARAAFSRVGDPAMADGIETSRSALRSQLFDQFHHELSRLESENRMIVLRVIDTAFQFEALEYLASSGGLDDERLREALAQHLRAHLS